jgi:hypothetical protein
LACSLDVAWNRRILLQTPRTDLIVVFLIAAEQVTKMLPAEDNDMIQVISADGTDEPFGVSILLR